MKTQVPIIHATMTRTETYRALRLAEIDPHPKMIIKAPKLIDDFYLNILDCSHANTMAIALSNKIFTVEHCFEKYEAIRSARIYFPEKAYMANTSVPFVSLRPEKP